MRLTCMAYSDVEKATTKHCWLEYFGVN